MEQDFINKTAQQLTLAGLYDNILLAAAAVTQGLLQVKLDQKKKRKLIIDHMNHDQRRRMNKKVNKIIKQFLKNMLKPSEQFAALPLEDQKSLLLKILAKVHELNNKFLEQKKDGEDFEEAGNDLHC